MEHSFKKHAPSGDDIRQSVLSLFSEIKAGLLSASENGRVGFECSRENVRVAEGWGRAEKDAGRDREGETDVCRDVGFGKTGPACFRAGGTPAPG